MLCLVTSPSVFAGGTWWEFRVLEFHQFGEDMAFAKLQPQKRDESPAPHCDVLSVSFFYRPEFYPVRTWSHSMFQKWSLPLVTVGRHREGIEALASANKKKVSLNLGVMGQGLIESRKCLFESRGLRFDTGYDGSKGVFSFNAPT
jgi:hypothetical protein